MLILAMDRSARRYDAFGRLHVASSHISKANVCPYYGREIPGYAALGLDANRIYRLLRDPEELAKAAPTFNNLQILREHVPVSAWDDESHRAELTVGSTGTDCVFDGEYLDNSLVIWAKRSIEGIERNYKRELSAAYRYTPDMTPGVFEGLQYDGIMRNITGNHVALVFEGRAGPDVLVGDESMKSRKAYMLYGALTNLISPRLAADSTLEIKPILDDVTAENLPERQAAISAAIVEQATPLLAQDQALTAEEIDGAITAIIAAPIAEDGIPEKPEPAKPAPKPAPKPESKPETLSMDQVQAKIDEAVANARKETRDEAAAIDKAKADVFPHVGAVVGMDSAAAIYKLALDAAKVDLNGVPESAYGPMVAMLPKRDAKIALDHRRPESKLDKVVSLPPLKVA